MAYKLNLMKFLQEVRGYDLVTNRHPTPKLNGVYLAQLRSHLAGATLPPRRKLVVSVAPDDASNELRAVRIVRGAAR